MKKHTAVLATLFAVSVVTPAFGQQSSAGWFSTHTIASDTTVLSDGTIQMMGHYRQNSTADDPAFPLHNTIADCVRLIRVRSEGTVESASGSCFVRDVDGDGMTFWWRMDAAGTADCAILCGSWGLVAGYGRHTGITGSGTWAQTAVWADGSNGTWQATVSMR